MSRGRVSRSAARIGTGPPGATGTTTMTRLRLPIGIQSFREVRERDCYYVDKTSHIPDAARRGQALLPLTSATLRQEPAPRHPEGALRGQRDAVRGTGHPRPMGLVGAASRPAAGLRPRPLPGIGGLAHGSDGPLERNGGRGGDHHPPRLRAGALRPPHQVTASAHGPAGRRAHRRVRQADSRGPGTRRASPAPTATTCADSTRSSSPATPTSASASSPG